MQVEAELRSLVGGAWVREAEAADEIDGVRPALVVSPRTAEEIAGVMALASRAACRVAPRGTGTKMGLGNRPERIDLVLDVSRLDRVIEHAAGDLVVTAEAGAPLGAVQAELAHAGQLLALDPPGDGGTIGGVIATNAFGPRRLRYGTVRDLLIGVTLVLADGTIAKAGGKVVKNVAGYDLSKLMCGSLGTLGVIVSAVFRLHPRPDAHRLVEVELGAASDAQRAAERLAASQLVPSAAQVWWRAGEAPRLGVLFEGLEAGVEAQAGAAAALFDGGLRSRVIGGNAATARWSDLTDDASAADTLELKISCLPARVAETLETVRTTAETATADWRLEGLLVNGILIVRMDGLDAGSAPRLVEELRSRIQPGNVVAVAATPPLKERIDVWGPVGDAGTLMRRVKDRFDPDHLLNPGRFVEGI